MASSIGSLNFISKERFKDTHKQATIEVYVENIKELININGKSYYDVASKSINGKLNMKGTFIPKINLNCNRSQQRKR
ncbi:hypothetical protein Anas_07598 [Armadillidium nasatum]|uniref:Uncharacterized protein n=1 Tax=Armadillidium nasatum TaxID=96803 RepID=A0A5N5TJY3_9CRUS|nr:hypothetical protein Anas_07598 [Armadillidium nasatum]